MHAHTQTYGLIFVNILKPKEGNKYCLKTMIGISNNTIITSRGSGKNVILIDFNCRCIDLISFFFFYKYKDLQLSAQDLR